MKKATLKNWKQSKNSKDYPLAVDLWEDLIQINKEDGLIDYILFSPDKIDGMTMRFPQEDITWEGDTWKFNLQDMMFDVEYQGIYYPKNNSRADKLGISKYDSLVMVREYLEEKAAEGPFLNGDKVNIGNIVEEDIKEVLIKG